MRRFVIFFLIACGISSPAIGQPINGSALVLRSSGVASGTSGIDWTLSSDGYVGTYINLTTAAPVTFTVNASGTASGGLNPDMMISIADSDQSFNITPGTFNNYTYTTPTLAAGTYFVRTQLDNQTASATPSLTVGSLTVGGTGVSVLNANSTANALNAATTYATNYRAGPGTIALTNANGIHLGAGTPVQVKLISNEFNFAAAVYGQSPFSSPSAWLNFNSLGQNLAPTTSEQINYQAAIKANFNMIVPSNAGKWQNNEFTQNSVNMTMVDAMAQFAAQNGLGMRMHNLLWATQQPSFVNSLFSGTPGTLTTANKATLNTDINNRINYYVSQSNSNTLGTPRADSYAEMDVLNEPFHTQNAQDDYIGSGALGVAGVANVYSEVATAVKNAGANTRLMVNEYNVLQFSPQTISSSGVASGTDPYANWYLNGVQSLQRAGAPIGGIGMELYTNAGSNVDPTQMQQSMQNLSVAKDPNGNPMPLTLSEFGVATGQSPTAANYDADLTTALTMAYGDPDTTTFGFWGGVGGPNGSNGIYSLYDSNYNLTSAGVAWQTWMNQYNTNLSLTTNANGDVSFNGTYGMYDVIVGGKTYTLDLEKGTTNYGLMTPINASIWNGGGPGENWSTAGNWGGAALPANSPVIFAGSTGLSPNNDSTPGTEYAGITFNSGSGPFVITGNAINLSADVINNSASAQTINLNIGLQQNTNFNAASGDLLVGGNISGSFSLTKTGTHNLTLSGTNSYTGPTTVNGGSLIIAAASALPSNTNLTINAPGAMQVARNAGPVTASSLTINGSTLDLSNNSLIINFTGIDPIATIAGYLASGYAGGAWNGPGINTSAASANFGLGYADGSDGVVTGLNPGQIEVAYALYGDVNLDGLVNATDFALFGANFNTAVAGWDQGDFTYDGLVNATDFGLLGSNFGLSASGGAIALPAGDYAALDAFAQANGLALPNVPEPATLGLLLLGTMTLVQHRNRRPAQG